MHIEILVEDSSGKKLLDIILPKLIGENGTKHSWNMHSYKGIGNIPKDLGASSNPQKRILLERLPSVLQGYNNTPGIDAIVVVLDTDRNDCTVFLNELIALAQECAQQKTVLFRLAIEEIEAWYLGDREAIKKAYPECKEHLLRGYTQDSICQTWELLADAIYPGGRKKIKAAGWPLPGQVKHQWAEKIGPLLDPERNQSPSFCKLRDGIRRLVKNNNLT